MTGSNLDLLCLFLISEMASSTTITTRVLPFEKQESDCEACGRQLLLSATYLLLTTFPGDIEPAMIWRAQLIPWA